MSNLPRYAHSHSSPQIARQIISAELFWPFPLIVVGVLGILEPVIVGIALFLALVPWGIRLLVFGKLTRRAYFFAPLLLLVLGGGVSMQVTYDPAMSWPLLLTLLGSVSLFCAVINTTVPVTRVAGGLVVVAGLVAFYFVVQYAHFDYEGEWGWPARLGQMTGSVLPNLVIFIPQVNAMAGFLEGVLLLSLVLTWQAQGGKRLAWGIGAVLIAYGLFISGSRGSWLGLAVALGIWGILLIPNQMLRRVMGGLAIAVVLLGIYAVSRLDPAEQTVPFLASALEAADGRLALYRNSLYLLGDYPFTGIGLGDVFSMIYSRYQLLIPVPFLTYSHNLFLTVGLGLGLLGLIGLFWLLISFYYFVFRVERAGLSEGSWPFFRAAWLGVTMIFVHGLIDAPQFSHPGWTMPMLFALLGLTVAIGRPALQRDRDTEARARSWQWIVLGIVFIGLIFAAVFFRQPLLSKWYANWGAVYQTQAELSPDLSDAEQEPVTNRAITQYEQALSLYPAQSVANRRFGIMALNREIFDVAVVYLERAYEQETQNQATLKALGLAYLWTGQLDAAQELLQQLDVRSELVEELGNWGRYWSSQDHEDRSTYAAEMVKRLSAAP